MTKGHQALYNPGRIESCYKDTVLHLDVKLVRHSRPSRVPASDHAILFQYRVKRLLNEDDVLDSCNWDCAPRQENEEKHHKKHNPSHEPSYTHTHIYGGTRRLVSPYGLFVRGLYTFHVYETTNQSLVNRAVRQVCQFSVLDDVVYHQKDKKPFNFFRDAFAAVIVEATSGGRSLLGTRKDKTATKDTRRRLARISPIKPSLTWNATSGPPGRWNFPLNMYLGHRPPIGGCSNPAREPKNCQPWCTVRVCM